MRPPLSLHNYESAFTTLPPGQNRGNVASTHTLILPYVEASNGHALFDFNYAMTATQNDRATVLQFPFYQCPTEPSSGFINWPAAGSQAGKTNYLQNMGTNTVYQDTTPAGNAVTSRLGVGTGMFYQCNGVKFRDVSDGLSNTVMFAETKRGQMAGTGSDGTVTVGSGEDYASPINVIVGALGGINNPYDASQCNASGSQRFRPVRSNCQGS